ncbi:SPOSA6832_00923 [Sporobolomyces salmonicolor]|uniref:SPOSA6832_00923-mRNA-1:cds n=1 Tax=Sporidiobolus salmonicolor TaxID=5005 RepID=A0A0D6EH96_SPOSA|nr:SPOSA6832_00923 [Sporobolomyces salmonicolor]
MAAPPDRYAHARAILGEDLFAKLQNSRVLVVGAGGIGCELLKNMGPLPSRSPSLPIVHPLTPTPLLRRQTPVMSGFGGGPRGQIHVLDLDTIDLSNLNRQFLFQKQHVKRPKAVVARETALKFNPHVNITALHRNIKDTEFNVDYFKSFDFVMNALDNLDARRHVNRMCLAANIPLIESGTSGYRGQVQPILKDVTDCFDCSVCTIRSTPSTAHHCIAWAKSYLFPCPYRANQGQGFALLKELTSDHDRRQLFGADDEADQQELDDAEKNGENVDEIQELRKEAAAVRELRAMLTQEGAPKRVFDKVYTSDIHRLLKMEDMWAHRKPPHPLSFEELQVAVAAKKAKASEGEEAPKGIKDQRKLKIEDSFELFVDAVERLSKRIDPTGANPLSFDKDDDDTLDFVAAAANLRAAAFGIESQTRFQVKEYAGNIIPAIATTNAIIAGVLVLQALSVLRQTWTDARSVWLKRQADKVFDVGPCSTPNPYCAVCRVVYLPVSFVEDFTLGEFVQELVVRKVGFEGSVSVQEGSRLLWESEDFENNGNKTMKELGLGEGKFVTVNDDDEPHYPVSFSVGSFLPADSPDRFALSAAVPSPIPLKAPPPAALEPDSDSEELVISTSAAGTAGVPEDDDLVVIEDKASASFTSAAAAAAAAGQLSLGKDKGEAAGAPGAVVTGKKRSVDEAGLLEDGEGAGAGAGGGKGAKPASKSSAWTGVGDVERERIGKGRERGGTLFEKVTTVEAACGLGSSLPFFPSLPRFDCATTES